MPWEKQSGPVDLVNKLRMVRVQGTPSVPWCSGPCASTRDLNETRKGAQATEVHTGRTVIEGAGLVDGWDE